MGNSKLIFLVNVLLVTQYSVSASILSWLTGGSNTDEVTVPSVNLTENGKGVNLRSPIQYPEESGECTHWGDIGLPPPYGTKDVLLELSKGYQPYPFPSDFVGSHQRLPVGTIVTVTNIKNGKTVRVRVVPPKTTPVFGRVMDLSPAAFSQLEHLREGLFMCTVRVIQAPRTEMHTLTSHTFDEAVKSKPTSYVPRDLWATESVEDLGERHNSDERYNPHFPTVNYD